MSFWDDFKAGAEEGHTSFLDLITGLFNLSDNDTNNNTNTDNDDNCKVKYE